MSRRRKAVQAGTLLAALGGLVALGIQVDRYLLERRQVVAQMAFQEAVRACEMDGGKWFRGECRYGAD